MRRLAIYLDDTRFEFALWGGDSQLTCGGDRSIENGLRQLERIVPDEPGRETLADVVVHYGKARDLRTGLPTDLTALFHQLPAVRMTGNHPREGALFGWARSVGLLERKPRYTVIDATTAITRSITYDLRHEVCEEDSIAETNIEKAIVNAGGGALVLLRDTDGTNAGVSKSFSSATRPLICRPTIGAFALGLLHSDIVISESTNISPGAYDREIEAAMATTMDTVFDRITFLGYDLDNGICRRELELFNTDSGASTMIEPDMRIDRSALIERAAKTHAWEAAQIEIERALVTGIIEPLHPDGSRMIQLLAQSNEDAG